MNLLLKIVKGPNSGAEIALIEGVNIKLGRSDECDVILTDQSLPDVACEIEVGSDRVMLLLPGGRQVRLEPLHVKSFETTAIAIGPADAPWDSLIWPADDTEEPEEAPEETPEEKPAEEAPPKPRWRLLQWILLVTLILVVILEFALWFFWPFFNKHITTAREWCLAKYEKWTEDKLEQAAKPVHTQTLQELATSFGVTTEVTTENSEEKIVLKGNLKTRAERLRLIADAYGIQPGITLELTDDESLYASASELLNMVTEGKLKVASAIDRRLEITGEIGTADELRYALQALKDDVPHIEHIDCSKVTVRPTQPVVAAAPMVKKEAPPAVEPVQVAEKPTEEKQPEPAKPEVVKSEPAQPEPQKPVLPRLPIVGVMTTPVPCLVLRNGSRVVEGAEFNGFVISKISEDVILLKNGQDILEWRP